MWFVTRKAICDSLTKIFSSDDNLTLKRLYYSHSRWFKVAWKQKYDHWFDSHRANNFSHVKYNKENSLLSIKGKSVVILMKHFGHHLFTYVLNAKRLYCNSNWQKKVPIIIFIRKKTSIIWNVQWNIAIYGKTYLYQ